MRTPKLPGAEQRCQIEAGPLGRLELPLARTWSSPALADQRAGHVLGVGLVLNRWFSPGRMSAFGQNRTSGGQLGRVPQKRTFTSRFQYVRFVPEAAIGKRRTYFAAVAAFSINAATSCACERKIAWLPGSSMTCDWARFAMNRSRSGLIIRSCVAMTA